MIPISSPRYEAGFEGRQGPGRCRIRVAGGSTIRGRLARGTIGNLAAEIGWQLIPELGKKTGPRTIRPDASLRNRNSPPRGYWEAKDTHDVKGASVGA